MRKFLLTIATCTLCVCIHSAMTQPGGSTPQHASETQSENEWTVINLETPGTLGREILHSSPDVDNLSDIVNLRVTGIMNGTDWTTLKGCTNIENIDLSGAVSTSYVPGNLFQNNRTIHSVYFPEGVNVIGKKIFSNSSVSEVHLPASLETLEGQEHFFNSSIQKVTFAAGCRLSEIPTSCFNSCRELSEIAIPDAVTKIGNSAFNCCYQLIDVVFPDNLHSIGNYAFQNCNLTILNLPEQLSELGYSVFTSNSNLTEIVLPSALGDYKSGVFYYCNAIRKITCMSVVPPSLTHSNSTSPTFSVDPSLVDLVVPEMALTDYKLSPDWFGYKSYAGGPTPGHWYVSGKSLELTDGFDYGVTPSVNISDNGCVLVSAKNALHLNQLTFSNKFEVYVGNQYVNTYGMLINSCPAMSASSVRANFRLNPNKWYFISLPFNACVADITCDNSEAAYVIRYYDGAYRALNGVTQGALSWKDVSSDDILEAGRGYIIQTNGTATFTFTSLDDDGMFSTEPVTLHLQENLSLNTSDSGWNLTGNPRPSYYDMAYTMLTCPVTLWDMDSKRYMAYSLLDDEVILEPFQPFFIQSTSDMQDITFDASGCRFSAEPTNRESKPINGHASDRYLFNIKLSNGETSDRTRVVINDEAATIYEPGRDAAKFFSDTSDLELYTLDEVNTPMAINERPAETSGITLGYYTPDACTLTLLATRADGNITLVDNQTGKQIKLDENNGYTFESEAGYNTNRFSLILHPEIETGIDNMTDDNQISTIIDGHIVTVNGYTGQILVFNIDGTTAAIIESEDNVSFSLLTGTYVIKAGNKSFKCVIR